MPRKALSRTLCAVAVVAIASTLWLAGAHGQAAEGGAPSLEALLDEAGFAYAKQKFDDGNVAYRVTVEANGEISVIVASERTMGWKDAKGNDVKLVYIWSTVTPVEEGVELPAPLLKRMGEINDVFLVGSVSAPKGGIYYCNSFWLRTADAEILADELFLAHNTRGQLQKELLPFLSEG